MARTDATDLISRRMEASLGVKGLRVSPGSASSRNSGVMVCLAREGVKETWITFRDVVTPQARGVPISAPMSRHLHRRRRRDGPGALFRTCPVCHLCGASRLTGLSFEASSAGTSAHRATVSPSSRGPEAACFFIVTLPYNGHSAQLQDG